MNGVAMMVRVAPLRFMGSECAMSAFGSMRCLSGCRLGVLFGMLGLLGCIRRPGHAQTYRRQDGQ